MNKKHVTLNNNLIVEPYRRARKIRAKGVSQGFATPEQKTNLVPLTLLVDANIRLQDNLFTIKKGSRVYFREEDTYTQPVFSDVFNCSDLETPFSIVPYSFAIMADEEY